MGWKREWVEEEERVSLTNPLGEQRNGVVVGGGMWVKGRILICFAF